MQALTRLRQRVFGIGRLGAIHKVPRAVTDLPQHLIAECGPTEGQVVLRRLPFQQPVRSDLDASSQGAQSRAQALVALLMQVDMSKNIECDRETQENDSQSCQEKPGHSGGQGHASPWLGAEQITPMPQRM